MNEQLLELFYANPGKFLSGEQLSQELHCSRTAVWKHIKTLREQGYTFESIPRRGYKLVDKPDVLDPAMLLSKLQTRVMGQHLRLFNEVSSTQDIAHKLVKEGAEEGTLVLADRQTTGRGRMGRQWHSPQGKGVWMSLVLKPDIPIHFTPQLTLLTAVALCRALRKLVQLEIGIKWPNDLLIGSKKISGILLESSGEDERLNYVIAGVGVSANLREDDFPESLRSVATSLYAASGQKVDRMELVRLFLEHFEELYDLYNREGFSPIKTLWEALNVTLGRTVRVRSHNGVTEGTALSLDDSGALWVQTKYGEKIKVFSGEINF